MKVCWVKQNKNHIIYVLSRFPTISETFIVEELLELKRRGFQLTIFSLKSPKKDEPISSSSLELMPFVFYCPFINWPILVANYTFLLTRPTLFFQSLLDIFRSLFFQPIELLKSLAVFPKTIYFSYVISYDDVIRLHAHFCNVPFVVARWLSKIHDVPFSVTAHNFDIFQQPPIELSNRIKSASPFITISEFNRKELSRIAQEDLDLKIEVVHCGLDLDKFKPREIIARNPISFLTVARLEYVKGLDTLLNACQIIRNIDQNFVCNIIGEGSQRHNLETRILELDLTKYVNLLGSRTHEEVIFYFQQAEIFILPSRLEGIPVSIMEAMALGIPVVSTNITGIPELIDDGRTGLLVPPDNPSALADAIIKLMGDSTLRKNVVEFGRKKIENEFNIIRSVDRLLNLWDHNI